MKTTGDARNIGGPTGNHVRFLGECHCSSWCVPAATSTPFSAIDLDNNQSQFDLQQVLLRCKKLNAFAFLATSAATAALGSQSSPTYWTVDKWGMPGRPSSGLQGSSTNRYAQAIMLHLQLYTH